MSPWWRTPPRVRCRRATWLFPAYLILINLFVIPIALAGQILLDPSVDADSYVLTLPMRAGSEFVTLVAFLGGLSRSDRDGHHFIGCAGRS